MPFGRVIALSAWCQHEFPMSPSANDVPLEDDEFPDR